jgi:hypothetical protein
MVFNGKLESVTIDNSCELGSRELDDFSGYLIPKQVLHVWNGHTSQGKPVKIEMNFGLNNLLDKIDVLSKIIYL